jgi:hypothetical protein
MSNEKLREALNSLPIFAEKFLRVRAKSGLVKPFRFWRGQNFLHERLENQLKITGKVRAVLVKGRQGGYSTYTQARYFKKVSTERGKKAFILAHQAEATKNIFNITKNYYELLPKGLVPVADTSSAKELNFKSLNSGYAVATAGSKGAGRSQTIQLFHGSEVAYWPNAEEHAQGVLQAVSNEPGTEIILESTAQGMGNYFHNMWLSAISGESEFQAIFIPWFWQDEYTADARDLETTSLSDEEQELMHLHAENGLTIAHLYWRRRKLKEFSNDHQFAVERFSVEYPMTSIDAFRNPVEDRLIKANLVLQARKNKVESSSPLVIGCDPAVSDTDRFAIIRRRGRLAYNVETHHNMKSTEIVYHIVNLINRERPAKVCIDSIGIGGPICDRLIELGHGDIIEPVNVARKSNDKERYLNLRAELWDQMKEWLAQEMPVQIPDSDELMTDLTSLGYHHRNAGGKLQIESKEDLKARGMKSPDIADALALTFYVGEYLNANSFSVNRLPEKAAGMFL